MGNSFATSTMVQAGAIPPAMQEAMQQTHYAYPGAYPAETSDEDQGRAAQSSPFVVESLPQQAPLVEPNIVPATPPSPHAIVSAEVAASPSSQAVPSTPPDESSYVAPDMQPLTMYLSEDVISNLVQEKAEEHPLEQQKLQDDPFLEAMMRQAQMGLFVLPDKETAESTPGGNTAQE
jgi:hypothetical protein